MSWEQNLRPIKREALGGTPRWPPAGSRAPVRWTGPRPSAAREAPPPPRADDHQPALSPQAAAPHRAFPY